MVNVTRKFNNAITFGAVLFVIKILVGIYLLLQMRRQIIMTYESDIVSLNIKCIFGLVSLS